MRSMQGGVWAGSLSPPFAALRLGTEGSAARLGAPPRSGLCSSLIFVGFCAATRDASPQRQRASWSGDGRLPRAVCQSGAMIRCCSPQSDGNCRGANHSGVGAIGCVATGDALGSAAVLIFGLSGQLAQHPESCRPAEEDERSLAAIQRSTLARGRQRLSDPSARCGQVQRRTSCPREKAQRLWPRSSGTVR